MSNRNTYEDEVSSALDIAADHSKKTRHRFFSVEAMIAFGMTAIAGLIAWQTSVNS